MMNWRKSSYSHLGGTDQGNCVELGGTQDAVCIRDTKQQGRGPILTFSRGEFARLVNGIKSRD